MCSGLICHYLYATILKSDYETEGFVMKKLICRASLIFSAVNLVLFLISFIPIYVMELEELPQWYSYFTMYSSEVVTWLLPCSSAVITCVIFTGYGMRDALIRAIPLALTNLVYTIPYYYLIGIAYRLDSIESILLSLGVSTAYVALFYALAALLFFAAKFILGRSGASLCDGDPLDLSSAATLAVFTISAGEFLIRLVIELWQAAEYFIEYFGDYRGDDILYMVIRFVFLLAMLFISHAICFKVKSASLKLIENDL